MDLWVFASPPIFELMYFCRVSGANDFLSSFNYVSIIYTNVDDVWKSNDTTVET